MKKISVVIPVYNAESTIELALDSILNQTYPVSEIILINDGSSDNSEKIIKSYILSYPDMKFVYVLQKNQGPSVARNNGIKKATSEFITFLDSDDVWLPNKNDLQISAFRANPDVYLVGGWSENEFDTNFERGTFQNISFKKLLKSNIIRPIVMIKAEVFSKVGYFPEDQKYSEDYNLWLRIIAEFKGGIVNESLYSYDNDDGVNYSGLSGNLWGMEKGELHNYNVMRKLNYISVSKQITLSVISILKYLRRVIIKQKSKLKS